MRIKNPCLIVAQVLLDFRLNPLDLLPRSYERAFKTGYLIHPLGGVREVGRQLNLALDVNKNLAIGNALRGSDALHYGFRLFCASFHWNEMTIQPRGVKGWGTMTYAPERDWVNQI